MSLQPLPPHPKLDRYYRSDEERPGVVRDLFEEGAQYYEWICRLMSFGTGESYRRRTLSAAGLEAGMRILDVAAGTGLVLRSAADITGRDGLAVGLDPSPGMLRECARACAAPLLQGRGEQLPFASESFEMVSMGYALRHVADLRVLFSEFLRVLRPGGRVVVLEITQPRSPAGRWMNRLYLRTVVPGLARMVTGAPAASRMMDYFWETIEKCVTQDVILTALREVGFAEVSLRTRAGVLSEYQAARRDDGFAK
ncbi:MAG TPA: class I SAM-dependent methyltransferase [Thermoanaerobaculia bacterium]|nr:class I SAM-dependent methyltransferase [Thermoanaerobaculia bacterium]